MGAHGGAHALLEKIKESFLIEVFTETQEMIWIQAKLGRVEVLGAEGEKWGTVSKTKAHRPRGLEEGACVQGAENLGVKWLMAGGSICR